MISSIEIKEKAREYGVPTSTIERDYAQNWLLAYLQRIPMALKGGTGIRKVYIENYRFSDDLDFTLFENLEADMLQAAIVDAVVEAGEESGIAFEEDVGIHKTESGYQLTPKFRILHNRKIEAMKIKLDITEPSNEQIFLPTPQRPIFHQFSDALPASVTSYSLEEIMAEKIRSLFQRTRPRDLYDICRLDERVRREDVRAVFSMKCEYKGISPELEMLHDRRTRFQSAWEISLRHQIRDVPDFDEAFDRMTGLLEYYVSFE